MKTFVKLGDAVNRRFAAALTVCTAIGVAVTAVFGALYLAGLSASLDSLQVAEHWDKSAERFWLEMGRGEIEGYSWFFGNLFVMDSLSMLGIALLSLAPLIGILFALPSAKGPFVLLFSILVAEFIFSIVRALF